MVGSVHVRRVGIHNTMCARTIHIYMVQRYHVPILMHLWPEAKIKWLFGRLCAYAFIHPITDGLTLNAHCLCVCVCDVDADDNDNVDTIRMPFSADHKIFADYGLAYDVSHSIYENITLPNWTHG